MSGSSVLLNIQKQLTQTQFSSNNITFSNSSIKNGISYLTISGLTESQLLQLKLYSSYLTTANYNSNLLLVDFNVSTNNSQYTEIHGGLKFAKQSIQYVNTINTSGSNNNTIQPFINALYGEVEPYLNINQLVDVLSGLGIFSESTSGNIKTYQLTFASISSNIVGCSTLYTGSYTFCQY